MNTIFYQTLPTVDRWKISQHLNKDCPSSWEVVSIGEIANIQNGYAFDSKQFHLERGIPLIRIRDVGADDTKTHYLGDYEDKYIVNPGDILIGMDGEFRCRKWKGRPGLLNQRVCKILLNSLYIEEDFFYCFIQPYLNAVEAVTSSVTVKHLSSNTIAKLEIPLPPLNEQKRIVTKIEALQTRSTAVKEEIEAIKPLLNQFRQSVLASAFRGDLTKDWREQNPDVEPAEVLLERIRVERRQRWEEAELEKMKAKGKVPKDDKWKKKYKEPQSIDTEGLPELPDGWCWVSVEQFADVGTGATPLRKNTEYYDGGIIPWVTSGALNKIFIKTAEEHITSLAIDETNAKVFPKHTLLIAMYGEGKTRGKVSELLIEAATNQACAALILDGLASKIRPIVKLFFLKNYSDIRKIASGGVQPNLNLGMIKSTLVPLPPLNEQRAICFLVEQCMSAADNIEQQYQQAEIDLETLNQSILAKAFRGELVPQDPNDEPASVLLERIKEERDRAKATAKKSKTKKRSSKKKDEQLGIPGM